MKISIMGAPGSGKSDFAKALRGSLPADQPADLIDGYVEKLQQHTGLEYGVFATYPMNFQIACARLAEEQHWAQNPQIHTIVVGSIFETIVYNALRANRDLYWNRKDFAAETTVQIHGTTSMEMLGTFAALTADYDLLFFLPYNAETLLSKEGTYEAVLDRMIPESIEGFDLNLIILDGPPQQKVDDALRIIRSRTSRDATDESQLALADPESVGGSKDPDPQDAVRT